MVIKGFSRSIAIVCYPSKSGLNHYSYSLCRELSELHKRLYFITNINSEFYDAELNCEVVRLFGKTRYIWLKYFQFIYFIFSRRIDIIHFQSYIKYPLIDIFIFILFKLAGKKLIFTAHDVLPLHKKKYHPFIFKNLYMVFDSIIVHSEHSKRFLVSLTNDSLDIHVVPHGVYDIFTPDKPISKNDARKQLGINERRKVILFFGSINERKGAKNIIEQMQVVTLRDSNILLVMAGKNNYPKNILQKTIQKLNMEENVLIFNNWIPLKDVKLLCA